MMVCKSVLSWSYYYPFGMTKDGRSNESSSYRFGFNGKEKDSWSGDGNIYDYGFRIYNPQYAKFLSVDPLTKSYPELTPYQFASNTPLWAIDLDGLEAFFVHGTSSNPNRWVDENNRLLRGASLLYEISGNKTAYASFKWGKGIVNYGNNITNNKNDRKHAARDLARYIIRNMNGNEDITIIGHSHGGNVAIQTSSLVRKHLDANGMDNIGLNIITISTPVDNGIGSSENPKTHSDAIDNHIHLYNKVDVIQTSGANSFGGFDNTTFQRKYDFERTDNVLIDVGEDYNGTYRNGRTGIKQTQTDGVKAHSFDFNNSKRIKENIDNGSIQKIN